MSLGFPKSNENTAPPEMPHHKIHENEPWYYGMQFSARENIIEYITE